MPHLVQSYTLSLTEILTTNFYVLAIETHFCRVVFLGTGVWFFWSIVLLSFLGILAAYTTLLLVSNVSHFSHSLPE